MPERKKAKTVYVGNIKAVIRCLRDRRIRFLARYAEFNNVTYKSTAAKGALFQRRASVTEREACADWLLYVRKRLEFKHQRTGLLPYVAKDRMVLQALPDGYVQATLPTYPSSPTARRENEIARGRSRFGAVAAAILHERKGEVERITGVFVEPAPLLRSRLSSLVFTADEDAEKGKVHSA
jgi:hypothetical protein